jgi:hypothetical protein
VYQCDKNEVHERGGKYSTQEEMKNPYKAVMDRNEEKGKSVELVHIWEFGTKQI